jgi:AcrR family transcriptional regulator
MRRVAQELGTGAASLYAHVTGKDELLELILDRAAGDLQIPDADPARWREQLKQVARELRRLLSRPGLAQISLARIPTGPNSVVAAERIMAIARCGGLSDKVVAYLIDLLTLFVGAVAYEETLWIARLGPQGQEAMLERLGQIRDYFESLPADRFPNMVALAGQMMQPDEGDERFEFALDVLIGGLAAYSAARDT